METQGDRTLAASALKDPGLSLTKKQVKRGKAFDYRDMKAQNHNTLAFSVFTDPCLSLTKQQVELCRIHYEGTEAQHVKALPKGP